MREIKIKLSYVRGINCQFTVAESFGIDENSILELTESQDALKNTIINRGRYFQLTHPVSFIKRYNKRVFNLIF